MREPIYYPSDLLLTMGDSLLSPVMAWRTNGEVSHCIPVIRVDQGLDIRWPRPRIIYLPDLHARRIIHLRLTVPLTGEQMAGYWAAAQKIRESEYDTKSWWGHLVGSGSQAHRRPNCSEGSLQMYQGGGLLPHRSERLIAPQTFLEFAHGGLFTIVSDRRF